MTDFDSELDPYAAEAMESEGEFGIGECLRCGYDHWPDDGPIVTDNGVEYEYPCESPDTSSWYCPDCWKERKAIENSRANQSLDQFQ